MDSDYCTEKDIARIKKIPYPDQVYLSELENYSQKQQHYRVEIKMNIIQEKNEYNSRKKSFLIIYACQRKQQQKQQQRRSNCRFS